MESLTIPVAAGRNGLVVGPEQGPGARAETILTLGGPDSRMPPGLLRQSQRHAISQAQLCQNGTSGVAAILSGANGNVLQMIPQLGGIGPIPEFGTAVAGPGDLDGDGAGDVVVTSRFSFLQSAYEALAFSGGTGSFLGVLDQGPSIGSPATILSHQDITGDGVAEILTVRTFHAPLLSQVVTCVGGSGQGTLWSDIRLTPLPIFGAVLGSMEDINGDGTREVLLMRQTNATNTTILVLSGATGAELRSLVVSQGSASPASLLGIAISGTRDLDNDAIPDFAATLRSDFGETSLTFFSSATGLALGKTESSSGADALGASVLRTSDVDGDSVPDLVVGDPDGPVERTFIIGFPVISAPQGGGNGLGRVHAFSGASGSLLWMTAASAPNGGLGWQVVPIGDANGDGVGDLASSAPASGSIVSYPAGRVVILSGANGAILSTQAIGAMGEAFGFRLASVGDLDADGVSDWAGLSSLNTQSFVTPAYRNHLRLVSSTSGQLLWSMASTPAPVNFETDGFGFSLAHVGDLDGDGRTELAVGVANGTSAAGIRSQGYVGLAHLSLVETVTPIGSGCSLVASGATFSPSIGTDGGQASVQLGNPNFGITLSGAPPNAQAVLFYGAPSTSWNGLPLPLDLGPFGLPGCTLEVNPDQSLPLSLAGANPPGTARIAAPIPQDRSLSGLVVLVQWGVATGQPGAIALTNALRITLH